MRQRQQTARDALVRDVTGALERRRQDVAAVVEVRAVMHKRRIEGAGPGDGHREYLGAGADSMDYVVGLDARPDGAAGEGARSRDVPPVHEATHAVAAAGNGRRDAVDRGLRVAYGRPPNPVDRARRGAGEAALRIARATGTAGGGNACFHS